MFKEIAVGGTVYFHFAANETTGTAGDGATPLYDVRLCGAAASAAPTASGTPTLLTHANYGAGLHEIAIDTTGYAEGEYAVFSTLTISTVNPGGFVGSFVVRAAASTLRDLIVALQTSVTTIDDLLDSEVGAIKTKTDFLPSVTAGAAGGLFIAGSNAATSVTTALTANIIGNLTGNLVMTITELAALPGASPTLVQAIGLLYMALRNKIDITATAKEIHNDAGTVLATKTLSDDTTTYSETKMA